MDETAGSQLWLVRHGETEWSASGRHTSVTDLELTERGVEQARAVAGQFAGERFDLVLTSPLTRARRTAELTGFGDAEVDDDLIEWRYGDYEGITTSTIRETVPGWTVWTHPVPGGETAAEVGARVDRVVARARATEGRTLVFAHGHLLRVLTARWLELAPAEGRLFRLDTATCSVLGWERETTCLLRWNAR